MIGEINPIPLVRLSPGDEAKTQKPATELYIGQIMKAVVVKSMADDSAVIQLNQQFFQAKTPFRFQEGQILDVEIIANGQQPVLKLHQAPATGLETNHQLAQFLPKQGHPLVLLQGLAYAYQNHPLPDNIKLAIANVLQHIPNAQSLGQNFISQLLGSGIFLENLLAKFKQDLPKKTHDFKAVLLSLREQFQAMGILGKDSPIPSELIDKSAILSRQYMPVPFREGEKLASFLAQQDIPELLGFLHNATEASIARIHTQQLLIAERPQHTPYFLMFDIPVKNQERFDCVSFRFEESKSSTEHSADHIVHFALNPEQLGSIEGKLRLHRNTLDLHLYIERAESFALFESHRQELTTLLQTQDMQVNSINVSRGTRPDDGQRPNDLLVDISL